MLRWPTVPRNPRSSETREAPDESSPNEEKMPGSTESLGGGLIWIWEWGNSLIILYSGEATSGFWGDFWENLYGSVYTGWNTPFEILLCMSHVLYKLYGILILGQNHSSHAGACQFASNFVFVGDFPYHPYLCSKYVPNMSQIPSGYLT